MRVYRHNTWEEQPTFHDLEGDNAFLFIMEKRNIPSFYIAEKLTDTIEDVVSDYEAQARDKYIVLRAYSGVNMECSRYIETQLTQLNRFLMTSEFRWFSKNPELIAQDIDDMVISAGPHVTSARDLAREINV